jgi:hypothetical protein
VKEEKMKNEKAKKKAIVLVICTVFLAAVSGVFVAASTSEDVSALAEVDYISSVDVNEIFQQLYFSSINVTEDLFVSPIDVKEAYQGVLNDSLLGSANFDDCWLKYDDGKPEEGYYWNYPDFAWAVHFTNTCPGSNLKTALFALMPYNTSKGFEELRWEVREWTGSEPGSVIKSGTTTPTGVGWHEVSVEVTIPEDFVIALIDPAGKNAILLMDNSTPIDDRSWRYNPKWYTWDKWSDIQDSPVDFLIRAVISTENGENGDPKLCTIPDPPSHDFGGVPVNEAESWTFGIKNIGSGTLEWSVKKDQEWIGVSPSAGQTTTGIDTVGVKVDTYNMTVGETYTGHITVTSNGETTVGTIKVTPQSIPTPDTVITVTTDKFKYCPDDTMRISVNITNPMVGDVLFEWYGVKVEREEGVPQFSLWIPVNNRTILGNRTIKEDVPIVDAGPEPFEIILSARLVDPETGQVLAADSTCCIYCPT